MAIIDDITLILILAAAFCSGVVAGRIWQLWSWVRGGRP